MTALSAAGSNGQPSGSVARTLSSLFGIAAASSPGEAVARRRRDVEEITSELDESAAVQPGSSTSKRTEAYASGSRVKRGSIARTAGRRESPPASVPQAQRAPRRRFRPVQVRDRRFIHIFLLVAATRAPTGQMLIDFVRECSDGVFVLPPGVVYRELHTLEKERLITVRRGSRQRRYTLTDLGKSVLAARRREWETFSHGVARLLEESDDDDQPRRE
jgi:PadR family transcriptional regulator, regulatory protein PadR